MNNVAPTKKPNLSPCSAEVYEDLYMANQRLAEVFSNDIIGGSLYDLKRLKRKKCVKNDAPLVALLDDLFKAAKNLQAANGKLNRYLRNEKELKAFVRAIGGGS